MKTLKYLALSIALSLHASCMSANAQADPLPAGNTATTQAVTFPQKHPIWHKMWAPGRWIWKPIKKTSDKTGFTKVVVLVDDLVKAASEKAAPYQGAVGLGSSLYGAGVNTGVLTGLHR